MNEVRDVLLTVKNSGSMLPFNFSINKVSRHPTRYNPPVAACGMPPCTSPCPVSVLRITMLPTCMLLPLRRCFTWVLLWGGSPACRVLFVLRLVQVAGFRCTPSNGRLQPLQSLNVVVSFCPGQLGVYKKSLHVVVADGLVTLPLRVAGVCSSVGAKKTTSMGVDLPTTALQRSYNFVPQESGDVDVAATATILAESGFANSTVVVSGEAEAKGAWSRAKPWQRLLEEGGVTMDTVPTDSKYTGTLRDLQQVSVGWGCWLVGCYMGSFFVKGEGELSIWAVGTVVCRLG